MIGSCYPPVDGRKSGFSEASIAPADGIRSIVVNLTSQMRANESRRAAESHQAGPVSANLSFVAEQKLPVKSQLEAGDS